MGTQHLYMILAGCKPEGRFTEQHDVFFGIAGTLKELVPQLHQFWPEAKKNLHIDAWRKVTWVEGHSVSIVPREHLPVSASSHQLYFINLGGYQKNEFDEFHYKMLAVAENPAAAIRNAKQSVFYKQNGFKGASSHVDDKYGLDVDEVYNIGDILAETFKEKYAVQLTISEGTTDEIHLGYLQLWKIKD